jgi:glycine receptor beta
VESRCKKVYTSKSDLRTNDFSIVGSLPRDFALSNFDCYGKPVELCPGPKGHAKAHRRPPPPKAVIPSAAKRVDLYARALFPFTFLFFPASVRFFVFHRGLLTDGSSSEQFRDGKLPF